LGHWHGYFYEGEGTREAFGIDTMMTFVLEPGDGEQAIKANAWSNKGRFPISGSWSKDENDVVSINFEMSFPERYWAYSFPYWDPLCFKGSFIPERDALRGTWGYLADPERPGGPMEFRRIAPRYLTVYPSIKELADNKPGALWRFAIAAVLNDIRRGRWSWSHFSQRRDDRETLLSLTRRAGRFGKALDEKERERLCTAAQRLTPADACFYNSLINREAAKERLHA
jgi:Vacuolar sorting-associated protein 13, N-terminal